VISLSQDEYRINYLTSLLLVAVKSHLSLPDPTSPLYYRLEFEQLVYDLIDMNINTIDEIYQRFKILNLTLKTPFFCIVVKPTDTVGITRPLNPMINGLQKIFTDGHYSIYQRSIIGLIPTSHREIPSFNQEALIELLGHWSADIGFSSVATHLEHFRTFYLMSVQAIRFGCTFGHESGVELPIYHFEDYRIYHMIDMCKDGFTQLYCHEHLIYMCHPFIIRLYQYDQKNSSDLLHVLYTYFKFSCNLAQTSRELNFHRNTMMNKISKIESVLKTSLDDNQLRQSLTFSYLILRYISEYLKKDIFAFNVTFKAQPDD
jgi:sugar diacid utilization regulator